ncbi:hypothetical protein GQ55_1G256200 [Panicum hallii var. hallii]|uniref:Uncharacterized protein n=1 Tax=Panicum hallii var. hallii TaxID=1504633 RepID=A0A2T7F7F6_9POAL|nr:hypothetical protein GQ55_1G256200 [Panicum hallii var. hallii]
MGRAWPLNARGWAEMRSSCWSSAAPCLGGSGGDRRNVEEPKAYERDTSLEEERRNFILEDEEIRELTFGTTCPPVLRPHPLPHPGAPLRGRHQSRRRHLPPASRSAPKFGGNMERPSATAAEHRNGLKS